MKAKTRTGLPKGLPKVPPTGLRSALPEYMNRCISYTYMYIYSLTPSLHRHPCQNEARSLHVKNNKLKLHMNFYFRTKALDLLCSNVKGGAFSSGNSIVMQRERDKQKDKSKKVGRPAKSVGGTGRCRVGKGRQTKKAEREQAEQQTGESKR